MKGYLSKSNYVCINIFIIGLIIRWAQYMYIYVYVSGYGNKLKFLGDKQNVFDDVKSVLEW